MKHSIDLLGEEKADLAFATTLLVCNTFHYSYLLNSLETYFFGSEAS
jgi:hypothetical protein